MSRGKKIWYGFFRSAENLLILDRDITFIVQKKEADYHDFVGIIVLLIINSTISFIEENNAGNAAAALMARLAPKAKVLPVNDYFRISLFIAAYL